MSAVEILQLNNAHSDLMARMRNTKRWHTIQ